jgi:hypothetical protein
MIHQRFRIIATTSLAVLGTLSLLLMSVLIDQKNQHKLELFFLYQLISLGVSGIVIVGVWMLNDRKLNFFRVGSWRAPATPVKILGITANDNWRKIGFTFAMVISGVTLMFMIINTYEDLGNITPAAWMLGLACAIPLSAVNAFNEEIITRWSIAEGFTGSFAKYAPWVSAVIFGSVHYFGTPGGLIGSLMAGFLGWFLVRSIQDTKGLGWAWVIHFLQDIIILTITLALFI